MCLVSLTSTCSFFLSYNYIKFLASTLTLGKMPPLNLTTCFCLYLSSIAMGFISCRQECACTPVHYFVVLSMQRSGSGWFETLLNNHPNISSHGEIFSVKPRRKNFTTITTTLDTIYNLDWYSSAAKNECTAAVGLKWMLNQVYFISCSTNRSEP